LAVILMLVSVLTATVARYFVGQVGTTVVF
jgi:hypothetical protein